MLPIFHRNALSAARGLPGFRRAGADGVGGLAAERRRRSDPRRLDAADSLRRLIARFDATLSRRSGVRTFSVDPRCLLRFAAMPTPYAARLPDGVTLERDATVADLHLWNEHVPQVPSAGPNLAWGRAVWERLDFSMRELAHALRTDPSLRGVRACRARTNFAGPGCATEAITRLTERCGFRDVDEGPATLGGRIHDGFENLLIAALVWTHNPGALSSRKLMRVRRPVWISRERLLALYPEQ